MPIIWTNSKPDSHLIDSLRLIGWHVKIFASLRNPSESQVRDLELVIYDLQGKPPSETFRQICQVKASPLLVIASNWDWAWQAIEAGADDALITPYDPNEALFYVRRLVYQSKVIHIDNLKIDLIARRVWRGHEIIVLSPTEFDLLDCLARHIGQAVSADQILDEVWCCDPDCGGTLEQIKSTVKRLRKKIEPKPSHPQYVLSVRGVGYRLRSQLQWQDVVE
jgi:DNA-binding response OmpR family regulator